MSFCIRSISNNNRYVPAFILSVQGCTARKFSNRQSLKLGRHIRMSTFLNDFLRSNLLRTLSMGVVKDKLTTTNRQLSSNTSTEINSVPINNIEFRKNIYREKLHKENNAVHHNLKNKNSDLFFECINRINCIDLTRDQLVHSYNSIQSENQIPIVDVQNSLDSSNVIMNHITVGTFTKDKTKVKFATVCKTATAVREKSVDNPITKTSSNNKPEKDNLECIYNSLSENLPYFFTRTMDYRIYHKDLEFVNNIRGTVAKGLTNYIKEMALLRMFGHLRYANVKFEILKITMHTQDNTVRVRWRINGISGMKVILTFWRIKVWKLRESLKEKETWYDGYSTFYVGDDGLVYKHIADKMMPDEEAVDTKTKTGISSKLASQLTFSSFK